MRHRMFPLYDNSEVGVDGFHPLSYVDMLYKVDLIDIWEQTRKDHLLITRFPDNQPTKVELLCLCWLPITQLGINNVRYSTTN